MSRAYRSPEMMTPNHSFQREFKGARLEMFSEMRIEKSIRARPLFHSFSFSYLLFNAPLSIVKASTLGWLSPEGAPKAVLQELSSKVGPLPDSYLRLLAQGNGGEVGLTVMPLNFCLDSAESALDYWQSGKYTASGVFVFGSDGGGSYLAFDLSNPEKWPVVCFDPIDPEGSMEVVAPGFESFLALVEHNK